MPWNRFNGPERGEATFIGLDLVWGTRNPTGAAVMRNGELVAATARLLTDDASLSYPMLRRATCRCRPGERRTHFP